MSKGLEALKRIKSRYNDRVCIDILEDFDLVEKELKALEIIKKYINMSLFETIEDNTLGEVHYLVNIGNVCAYQISKEEYDLLKEVLL